ncbi:hypothetical protein ADK34_14005 [Streptomyces viridochromogenes]|uniref:SseB protein N-terminal domain-containing protein n=1 Tax=Streptomyces viridochromogenes TaxID=1938 RepID=A0A0L8KR39_STRVR|nr:hypothetical protein ADK34_14005 [Streptomyces viridochromogenes]
MLGEFRRTAVLVPHDDHGSLWTADFNGVRWICAFSHEEALARFADARGESAREWTYQTILGARLLDVMVPLLPGPGGVALDAGSTDGMVFPPVTGIVPDEVKQMRWDTIRDQHTWDGADWSPESFEGAHQEVKQTWKNTTYDVEDSMLDGLERSGVIDSGTRDGADQRLKDLLDPDRATIEQAEQPRWGENR